MSIFDPEAFLNTDIEGSCATSFSPIPDHEALLVVKKVEPKASGDYAILDVTFLVDSDEAREETGQDEPTVRVGIFLDIDDNGMLDLGKGKNVQLGRLRAALGQNDGGAWSPAGMVGETCLGHVTQRPDKNDSEKIYNDVKQFTALA